MNLVLATEQQKRERDRVTHAAWGSRLSLEKYCEREEVLRRHPWSQSALSSWLLCTSEGEVLSSCETYRMLSLTHRGGRSEQASSHAVASVFTEPKLRRKGYAAKMMMLLMERLSAENPRSHASILFSDVGPALYERAGFVARPASDWIFPPAADRRSLERIESINDGGVPELISSLPSPAHAFFVWPSAIQIDWCLERERFYTRCLGRPSPQRRGARNDGGSAVWMMDLMKDELIVLLLHASSPRALEPLIRAAQYTAQVESLRQIRVWESGLSVGLPSELAGGTRMPRQGSLPMLRSLDARIRAQDWTWIPKAIWV